MLVNSDGSNPRVLGDGAMPAFSPRASRLAISRYAPNQGVWIMSSEGPAKELVLLDAEGWGTDWSPDGRHIVYAIYEASSANLVLYDLVEGTRMRLFEEGTCPYGNLFWNFTFSPDGRYIVFKGLKADGKYEVAMVDARGARHGLIVCLEGELQPNFGWSHDSTRLFFSKVPRARRPAADSLPQSADQRHAAALAGPGSGADERSRRPLARRQASAHRRPQAAGEEGQVGQVFNLSVQCDALRPVPQSGGGEFPRGAWDEPQ